MHVCLHTASQTKSNQVNKMSCCLRALQYVNKRCGVETKITEDELGIEGDSGTYFTAIAYHLHRSKISFLWSVDASITKIWPDSNKKIREFNADSPLSEELNKAIRLVNSISDPWKDKLTVFTNYVHEHKLYTQQKISISELRTHINKNGIAIASINGMQLIHLTKRSGVAFPFMFEGHALVITEINDEYVTTVENKPYDTIAIDIFIKVWTDEVGAMSEIILIDK